MNLIKSFKPVSIISLLLLVLLLTSSFNCKSGKTKAGKGATPTDKALVFFRMSCIPGELAWRSSTAKDSPYVVCDPKKSGTIQTMTVTPAIYQWLIFEDIRERVEWNRWTFAAPEAGKIYYWGDINILSTSAQLDYNENTISEFKKQNAAELGDTEIQRGLNAY